MALPVPGFWEKFEEMNGDSVQCVPGWALYETGAQRQLTPMGVSIDPPADLHERAKLILRYHEHRLRVAVNEFQEHRQQLKWGAEASRREGRPPPADAGFEQLRQLRDTVRKRREEVKQAGATVEDSIPAEVKYREEMVAANRSRNDEFLAKLSGIKV